MLPCNNCPQNNTIKTGCPACALPYCPLSPYHRKELDKQIRNLECLPHRSIQQEADLRRLRAQWATDLMLIGQRPPGGEIT
ncbi:MAG: hypothetical protein LKJ50_01705 [Clostridiales bacterium]|jgi:hypothetical protein|nr:hypothetical protein [Clostridiales bacterium]MCI1951485.1 hypothetical protein [Clostridiales bacterium]MCI1960614.1 hypothetical protein [Clostridiales bacterium]MCI1960660.1 hypothetical protein [Clostridiales bacterium]MCI2021101.1 hypothetical protein [Clostridiales bacterium]